MATKKPQTAYAKSALDQNTIRNTIKEIAGNYGTDNAKFTEALARYASGIQAGYDAQRKASDQQYALNRNAADRAAQQRGMGRSSYNLQTLANIDTQKAEANQQIWANQQADINKFAYQLDQDMRNEAWREKEFEFEKEKQQTANQQWEKQFAANQQQQQTQNEQWEKQFNTQNSQWEQQFNTSNEQWNRQFGASEEQRKIENQQWERQFNFQVEQANKGGGGGGGGRKPSAQEEAPGENAYSNIQKNRKTNVKKSTLNTGINTKSSLSSKRYTK